MTMVLLLEECIGILFKKGQIIKKKEEKYTCRIKRNDVLI